MELPTIEQVNSVSIKTSVHGNIDSKPKRRHNSRGNFQQFARSQSSRSLKVDIKKRLTRFQANRKHISTTRIRNKKANNDIILSAIRDENTSISNKKSVELTLSDSSDALSVLCDSNSVEDSSEIRSANIHVDCPVKGLDSPIPQDYFSDISEENDSDFHTNAMVARRRRAHNFV